MSQGSIIAKTFLYMIVQTQIYHWQTEYFNKHRAVGDYYAAVQPLMDQFIETYQGRFGIIKYNKMQPSFGNVSDEQFLELLKDFNVFLEQDMVALVPASATDLWNIRDEIVAQNYHVMYFLNRR